MRWAFAILICASALVAESLPIDPSITVGSFSNGVHYYIKGRSPDEIEEINGAARASLRLVVPVGSVFEEEGEEGVAHFVEHLLFRGTENFPQSRLQSFLQEIGASMGADVNAHTSFDETVYMLEIPLGKPGALRTGLELLSEWISSATLAERDIEEERGIILEEWRRGLGVNMRLMESAYRELTDGSRYAERLPIGLESTIRSVSPETIRAFYERWYGTSPVAVIVVGDFDTQDLFSDLVDIFEPIPRQLKTLPTFDLPEQLNTRYAITTDPELSDAAVELIFKERPMPNLCSSLLTTLFHQLVGERLKEMAESLQSSVAGAGIYSVRAIRPLAVHLLEGRCNPSDIGDAMANLAVELRRIQMNGFTSTELQRALVEQKRSLRHLRHAYLHRSHRRLAERCKDHFLHGEPLCNPAYIADVWEEVLERVTTEDLAELANDWDLLGNCTVHISVPDTDDVPIIDASMLADRLVAISKMEIAPYVDTHAGEVLMATLPTPLPIASERYFSNPDVVEYELGNGLRISLLATDSSECDILLTGIAFGGLSDLDEEELSSCHLATRLLNESGIGGHPPAELRKILAGRQADLVRYVGPYTREILASADREEVEPLFQLLHLIFTNQINDERVFDQLIGEQQQSLVAEQRNPQEAFFRRVRAVNRGDHYFYAFPRSEDLARAEFSSVDRFSCDAFANPAEFHLNFVGNFDPDALRPLIERYLATIPARGAPQIGWTPLEPTFPCGVTKEVLCRGVAPQSQVQITFPVTIPNPTPEQLLILEMATQIVGREIYDVLRHRLSGTYHVDTWVQFDYPDTEHGVLGLQFVCDPEDADLLSQVAMRELRRLKARGPLIDEVENALHDEWRELLCLVRQNKFWANELYMSQLFHWGHDSLAHVRHRLEHVTQEALGAQIDAMLSLDHYSVVILYPMDNPLDEFVHR